MIPRATIVALLLALAVPAACERADSHAAGPALRAFLDAVQYQDFDGALALHLEASEQGIYCTAEPFEALFEEARRAARPDQCAQITAAGEEALAGVDDETRLLLQIVGFHCRHPGGSCVDYGRRLYRRHLVDFAEQGIRGYDIRKVLGDDARAIGYVDLRMADGRTLHRSLRLRTLDGGWRVEGGLVDAVVSESSPPARPEVSP